MARTYRRKKGYCFWKRNTYQNYIFSSLYALYNIDLISLEKLLEGLAEEETDQKWCKKVFERDHLKCKIAENVKTHSNWVFRNNQRRELRKVLSSYTDEEFEYYDYNTAPELTAKGLLWVYD